MNLVWGNTAILDLKVGEGMNKLVTKTDQNFYKAARPHKKGEDLLCH
jgi:hypothetical protein